MSNGGYYLRRFWFSLFAGGAPLTVVIVALNVVAFGLQLFWQFRLHSTWMDETFALSPTGFAAGQYWQLISYAWLHSELFPFHILFNMLMVTVLGRLIEWPLGSLRFAVLYLGGCLSAALVWLWWDHPQDDAVIMGASGAVFALITANAVFDPHRRIKVWLLFVIPLNLTLRSLAILLVVSELIFQLFHWLPWIAHSAHLGGAVFGWVIMKMWNIRSTNYCLSNDLPTRL